MAQKKQQIRQVRYTDDKYELSEAIVTERNGNLSWVEDKKTGEGSYRSPHEIQGDW